MVHEFYLSVLILLTRASMLMFKQLVHSTEFHSTLAKIASSKMIKDFNQMNCIKLTNTRAKELVELAQGSHRQKQISSDLT